MANFLRSVRFAIVSAFLGVATQALAASGWALLDLGTLGGPGSYGAAVSNTGIVVGCSDVAAGGVHAFVYRDGAMRDLGAATPDGAGNSCALAVNGAGLIAGRSGTGELVLWDGSSVTRLGVQGNVGGINETGTVVGSYADAGKSRAFLYKRGVFTDLGAPGADSVANAVNGKDQVVGRSNGRAFLYEGGSLRDLGTLGGSMSFAKGINDRGQVVGMSSDDHGQPSPFIYDGSMRALPAGSYSEALAINDRMQVVGSGEGSYGYLIAGGQVTALDALPAVRAKGWHHMEPTGINDIGWIVGTGFNEKGDSRAFLLIPREVSERMPDPEYKSARLAIAE